MNEWCIKATKSTVCDKSWCGTFSKQILTMDQQQSNFKFDNRAAVSLIKWYVESSHLASQYGVSGNGKRHRRAIAGKVKKIWAV